MRRLSSRLPAIGRVNLQAPPQQRASGSAGMARKPILRQLRVFCASAALQSHRRPPHVLVLAYDRSRIARPHRRLRRPKGRIQAVGPRTFAPGGGRERRLLLEQLARLTVRGQLMQLDRDHWTLPRAASRPDAISLPAASICIVTATALSAPIANPAPRIQRSPGDRTFSFRPVRSTPPCRATRFWFELEPPKADGRQQGRIVQDSRAPQPNRRRHVSPVRVPVAAEIKRRPSLRRAHDASHRHPSRRGDPSSRRRLPRRIACSVARQISRPKPESAEGPSEYRRPHRRCRDHQLAHAHASSHRPRHRNPRVA